MSNSFIMTESIVRPAKMPYGRLKDNGFVGIEGEHAARALVVETKDDLSAFASINLIIDDLDCGAMTKTTSGNTTTLSMTLTSSMIGRSGRKICQLIMVNSGNTVVQKSSQFEAYVGRANEIERSVEAGVTIIILSEAVTEMAREAASAAAEEAVADVVEDCQEIANAAAGSARDAAQSAQEAEEAAASIVVDATLDPTSTHAIQNKAVASEISSIKADLGTITNSAADASLWEQGAINISNGSNAGSNVRLRTAVIPSNITALNILSGYECAICCYSGSTYVGAWNGTGFSTSTARFFTGAVNILPIRDYDIRLYLKSADGTSITIADATNVLFSALTDGTLTKQYIPADAKTTGDALALKADKSTTYTKTEVDTRIDDLMFADILLEQGGIQSADGTEMDSSKRVRTSYFYGGTITVPTGYKILYAIYYDADTLAFDSSEYINSQSAHVGRNGCLVRLTLSTNNTTDDVAPETFKRSFDLEQIRSDCDSNMERISVFEDFTKNADAYPNIARLKALNSQGTWNGNAYTYNGITYTVNADFSIAVSGTASANSSLRIHSFSFASDTDLTLFNPDFDSGDNVYVCRIAGNGAIQKYPKGVSLQTIPSGVQRILIRVESGKTVATATTKPVYMLEGAINDYLLKADAKASQLATVNYIPYQRYSYTGEILNPSQLKTAYSADNLLDAIYAFCDELVTDYPNFVTKQTLSYTGNIVASVSELPSASTVSNGDIYMVEVEGGYHQYICNNGAWVQMHTWDDNGNPIYLVKLTYPMYAYTISPYSGCDYPIILWCSGLHGSEDWSNVSTLYLFKELLANRGQNDDIDYLLSNFVIKIVPCCGVSACADRTLGAHAMSENGVNPNRDYPIGWEESQDEWRRTGNFPWYDPYNRIIKSYIESLSNIVYCINKHDSNTLTSDGYVNNIWDNYISAHTVEDCVFKQLDLTIKTKYPWLLSEFVGTGVSWNPNERTLCNAKYVYGGTYGTIEKWFNSIGIKGGLIETVCKTGTAYSDAGHDADFYRIALECDVMTLCAVAKNIKTLSISDELNTKFI